MANSCELTDRLLSLIPAPPGNTLPKEEPPKEPSPLLQNHPVKATDVELRSNVGAETTMCSPLQTQKASLSARLPAIPSFSEFVNRKKTKNNNPGMSENQSPHSSKKSSEKRMRLQ